MEKCLNYGEFLNLFDKNLNERQKFKKILNGINLKLNEIKCSEVKKMFDEALDRIHYAKSCQRVGRCVRLAVMMDNIWIGGIVLGSPFPNILVRDEALGLRKFVTNYKERKLKSPWVRENYQYWEALQTVVNHARAFIFPKYQGMGLGIKAQSLLFTHGVQLWEKKYKQKIFAFDNLCDKGDSKLFLLNGWILVGETKGYCSSSKCIFSKRVSSRKMSGILNNVGLARKSSPWQVWVKIIDQGVFNKLLKKYCRNQ